MLKGLLMHVDTNATVMDAMDRLEQRMISHPRFYLARISCYVIVAFIHESDDAVRWLQPWQSAPRCIPKIEEGTFAWIPQHDAYATWREGSYSKPLCICGPPG
jgi:hypothetical protein